MKTFFIWLTVQCVFAKVLLSLLPGLVTNLNAKPDDAVGVVALVTAIYFVEVIVSSIILYPMVNPEKLADHLKLNKEHH